VELRILAAPREQQALLDLPWDMPLEDWPDWYLVALPRGISRHVVRFTRLDGRVYAVKEVVRSFAEREYHLLRDLDRLGVPSVKAVGVVSGREAPDGSDLDAILITRHLQFSLPYRALFARMMRRDTVDRLIDDLWDGGPPAQAETSVQSYVSNLRRILEPERPPRSPATVLVTRPPGYAIEVDDHQLDMRDFVLAQAECLAHAP
jgi:hypothetical protein